MNVRIVLDGKVYNVSLSNIAKHLSAWYDTNKYLLDSVQLENGRKLDFSKKSILRIGLNTALVPIAIPALKMVYKIKGSELPARKKHEDFIDYFMISSFNALRLYDREILHAESIESIEGDSRDIHTVLTNVQAIARDGNSPHSSSKTEEDIGARGKTLLCSGENGYGEDETNQGDDREESFRPTKFKYLSSGHQETR